MGLAELLYSPLLPVKSRLPLPKVGPCMFADHENVLVLKITWEVDGDRAVANIRQRKLT